jgi:hypothetical protein
MRVTWKYLWKQVCGQINGLGNSVIRIVILSSFSYSFSIFSFSHTPHSSSRSLTSILRFLIIQHSPVLSFRFSVTFSFFYFFYYFFYCSNYDDFFNWVKHKCKWFSRISLLPPLFPRFFRPLLILLRLHLLYSLLPILPSLLNFLFLPILLFTILRYCLLHFIS